MFSLFRNLVHPKIEQTISKKAFSEAQHSFLYFYFCARNGNIKLKTHSTLNHKKIDQLSIFEQLELLNEAEFTKKQWHAILFSSPQETYTFLKSITSKSPSHSALISFLSQFSKGAQEHPSWDCAFALLPPHLRLMVLLSKAEAIENSSQLLQDYFDLFAHNTKAAYLQYPQSVQLPINELRHYFESLFFLQFFYSPSKDVEKKGIKKNDIPFSPDLFSPSSTLRFSFEDASAITIHQYLRLTHIFSKSVKLKQWILMSNSIPMGLKSLLEDIVLEQSLENPAKQLPIVKIFNLLQSLRGVKQYRMAPKYVWGALVFPICYALLSPFKESVALSIPLWGAGVISALFLIKTLMPVLQHRKQEVLLDEKIQEHCIAPEQFEKIKNTTIHALQQFNNNARYKALFQTHYDLNLSQATQRLLFTPHSAARITSQQQSASMKHSNLASLRQPPPPMVGYLHCSSFDYLNISPSSFRHVTQTAENIFNYSQIQEFNTHWRYHIASHSSFKNAPKLVEQDYIKKAQQRWEYLMLQSTIGDKKDILKEEYHLTYEKKSGFLEQIFDLLEEKTATPSVLDEHNKHFSNTSKRNPPRL